MILELYDGTRFSVGHVAPPEVRVRNGNATVTAQILFTGFHTRESAEYYCARITRALEMAKVRKAAAEAAAAKAAKNRLIKLDVLKVCKRMEEMEMNKTALAAAMGAAPQQMTEWLKGLESRVRRGTAENMAKALGVSLDAIRRS